MFFIFSEYKYDPIQFSCSDAPFTYGKTGWIVFAVNQAFMIVYSVVPAIISLYYYWQISTALFSRKKKVGRNLNLITAFGFSSAVWIFTLIVRAIYSFYSISVFMLVPFSSQFKHVSLTAKFQNRILSSLPVLTSILSPAILIIVLQNYRKPASARINSLKNSVQKLIRIRRD